MEYPVHLHCRKNQQWNMLKCNRAGDHYTLNKPSLLNKPAVDHAKIQVIITHKESQIVQSTIALAW